MSPAPACEPVEFNSQGETIHGLYRPANPPSGGEAKHSAVLICHGAFEHQGNWQTWAERLAAGGYAVLTFDFAGHGESGGLQGLVDMQVWAYNLRDAMNFLGQRGLNRFALVGWGSGGSAALLAAAHDPRIACVCVLAAPVLIMPFLAERVAYSLLSLVAKVWKKLLRRQFTLSRLPEFESLTMTVDPDANQRYLSDPHVRRALGAAPVPESLDAIWLDITAAAARITAPVLVLHGDKDRHVPLKQSAALLKLLKGPSRLTAVPGAGHALHFEPGGGVYAEVQDWIRSYL